MQPKFPLMIARIKQWGGSMVMMVPRALKDAMGFQHGDLVCLKIYNGYMVACRWPKPKIADLSDIPVDALPPLTPRGLKNGVTIDNRA